MVSLDCPKGQKEASMPSYTFKRLIPRNWEHFSLTDLEHLAQTVLESAFHVQMLNSTIQRRLRSDDVEVLGSAIVSVVKFETKVAVYEPQLYAEWVSNPANLLSPQAIQRARRISLALEHK